VGINLSDLTDFEPKFVGAIVNPGRQKKNVVGSSKGCRGGGCQTLACV